MTWFTPTQQMMVLSALRPLLLAALLMNLHPFAVAGVVAVESILIALFLAAVTPYETSAEPPTDTHTDLDGFSASWPARAGVQEELAGNLGFSSALWGGLGAIPVIYVGLGSIVSSSDGLALVFFSVVLGAVVAIPQLIATTSLRWAFNRRRQSGTIKVDLSGRVLRVGRQRWLRSHDDTIARAPGVLRLQWGDESLEIPGAAGCLDWLAARLEQTRPPPEDADAVPEALRALRQSPQRSST